MWLLPRGLGIFVVGIIDEILCAAQNVVGFSQIRLLEVEKLPHSDSAFSESQIVLLPGYSAILGKCRVDVGNFWGRKNT